MSKKHHMAEDLHFQLRSKAVLGADERELYELSQLAGITMDPQIFKIIMDMLKLNVSPVALASTVRSVCAPVHGDSSLSLTDSHSHHSSYHHHHRHSSSRHDRPTSRERGGGKHSTSQLSSASSRPASDRLKKSSSLHRK